MAQKAVATHQLVTCSVSMHVIPHDICAIVHKIQEIKICYLGEPGFPDLLVDFENGGRELICFDSAVENREQGSGLGQVRATKKKKGTESSAQKNAELKLATWSRTTAKQDHRKLGEKKKKALIKLRLSKALIRHSTPFFNNCNCDRSKLPELFILMQVLNQQTGNVHLACSFGHFGNSISTKFN